MLHSKQKRKFKSGKKILLRTFIFGFVSRIILAVGLIYLLILGISRLSRFFLDNSPYFTLSEVYVRNHFTLRGEDAFEFAGLRPGVNLFAIELSSIAKQIKHRHPEYEDVFVRRVPPDRVDVLLKERRPVMQIKLAKFYPIDKNGFVIPYAQDNAYPNLPVVIGVEPQEAQINNCSSSLRVKKAIELIAMIRTERFPWQRRLQRLNLTSLNDISLLLDNGLEVKIGGGFHLERLGRLAQVLDEIKMKGLSPSFIDLRFRDVIIGPK